MGFSGTPFIPNIGHSNAFLLQTLGRQLTFKECARCVVFTKLATSTEVTAHEAAQYMQVSVKTIAGGYLQFSKVRLHSE